MIIYSDFEQNVELLQNESEPSFNIKMAPGRHTSNYNSRIWKLFPDLLIFSKAVTALQVFEVYTWWRSGLKGHHLALQHSAGKPTPASSQCHRVRFCNGLNCRSVLVLVVVAPGPLLPLAIERGKVDLVQLVVLLQHQNGSGPTYLES